MILPRAALAPLAILLALLALTTGYLGGIADAPSAFFGGDTLVLGPPNGELPGRAEISASLVGALRSQPGVDAVSPEIYATTVLGGRSAMARGVEFEPFLALEGLRLVEGRLPANVSEAVVGAGFRDTFDADVGDLVALPSPLARLAVTVRVVGVVAGDSPAHDELLLGLDDARGLASVSPASAHLIRIRAAEPDALAELLDAVVPTFTYGDVRLSQPSAVPGEPLVLRANLTNWGTVGGFHEARVHQDGATLATEQVFVPARTTRPIALRFTLPTEGPARITLNPTLDVDVRPATLRLAAAPTGVLDEPFTIRVTTHTGAPVADVLVAGAGASASTDAAGEATLVPRLAGEHALIAYSGRTSAGATSAFFAEAAHATTPHGRVERLVLPRDPLGETMTFDVSVVLVNTGGAAGRVEVPLLLDDAQVALLNATLAPGGSIRLSPRLGPLAPGEHTLRVKDGPSATFTVYPGDNPRVEQLLKAYETARLGGGSAGEERRADAYIDELLGNVRLAVVALAIASGALATLGAASVLARHIAERAGSLGMLKALGASDDAALRIVANEAARMGAIAALAGLAAGWLLALGLDALGIVRAFGHALHPVYTWRSIAIYLTLSVTAITLLARLLARGHLQRTPQDLIAGVALRRVATDAPPLRALVDREEPGA